jgi:pyruvate/2-oxoglutarate dehydrogenase complex dihydrolipoamide acyltransferase (E2) component
VAGDGEGSAAAGARGAIDVIEATGAEQEFARRVAESKATVPHAYAELEAETGADGLDLPLVIAACGRVLRELPKLNGSYRDGRYELPSRVNVAFAVAVGATLAFPAVRDADARSPEEIAAEVERLRERARAEKLTQPDLAGATFSVADPGAEGITRAAAIVNRGQSAFLTVGAARQHAVEREGELHTSHRVSLTLAFDHRMHQGREPLDFLSRLRELLEPGP